MRMRLKNKQKGIASLPAILLLGGIIIEIGIVGAVLLFYLNNSVYGTRLSNEAFLAAQSGMDDAILRMQFDPEYAGSYNFAVGNASAQVTICLTCEHTITVVGSALTRSHTLNAVVDIDDVSGRMTIDSIEEELTP